MQCLVCNNAMAFSFSKQFNCFGLDDVHYWKCSHCGFTISKTHSELSDDEWRELNFQYHGSFQGTESCPDDPRWVERIHNQADVVADLVEIGILEKKSPWLDYACGDGKLSNRLKKVYNLELLNYDRYMQNGSDFLTTKEIKSSYFDFVITTSVFEHFTKRMDYDYVDSLVKEDGVLGLHTLVCEEIPTDPSWFYLLPVHTSFFTNKSMRILFKQWGYRASIYNVEARLWFWFKTDTEGIREKVAFANDRGGLPQYIFKGDFVDYWK